MRPTRARTGDQTVLVHRRLKVVIESENKDNNLFRLHMLPIRPNTVFHFLAQQFRPKLRKSVVESSVSRTARCWHVAAVAPRFSLGAESRDTGKALVT